MPVIPRLDPHLRSLGWATLVASLMFFSGVQLLSIGILGEYVGRIFDEVKHRPVYIVSQQLGQGGLALPKTGGYARRQALKVARGSDRRGVPGPAVPAARGAD